MSAPIDLSVAMDVDALHSLCGLVLCLRLVYSATELGGFASKDLVAFPFLHGRCFSFLVAYLSATRIPLETSCLVFGFVATAHCALSA